MGALQQYLDLYREQRAAVDAGSAGALNALRSQALAALAGRELPDRSREGYEKTSIDEMYAPDYGVNVNRVALPCDVAAAFRCGVPNVSTLLAVMVNDRFAATPTLLKNLPEGVTVMSLAEAARRHPAEIGRHYGSVASLRSEGTALNTLLAQDGIYIKVGRGVRVDRPIQVVTLTSAPAEMLTMRRLLIVAEEGAEVSVLVCDHSMTPSVKALNSTVTEVIAMAGAKVDICDIEETSEMTRRYAQTYVGQGEGSNVAIGGMTLRNGVTRNEFRVDVAGQRCETHISGMAIGSGEQHIDNSSDVVHLASRSRSMQLFKYVLGDRSRGAFEGSIEVTPGARFTEAYQTDRNIITGPDARMHAKPQLLIYNDDVKCSHGATTGRLDEKALFYMRSRGIPEAEARMMLMQAFLTEVVDTVRTEALRNRLRHLVERRLAGHDATCGDCGTNCRNN